MREGFRIHTTSHLTLNAIIANGRRGGETFFDIATLEDLTLIRAVSPYAREAVRLQFHADGEVVCGRRVRGLRLAHLS